MGWKRKKELGGWGRTQFGNSSSSKDCRFASISVLSLLPLSLYIILVCAWMVCHFLFFLSTLKRVTILKGNFAKNKGKTKGEGKENTRSKAWFSVNASLLSLPSTLLPLGPDSPGPLCWQSPVSPLCPLSNSGLPCNARMCFWNPAQLVQLWGVREQPWRQHFSGVSSGEADFEHCI